MAIRTISISSLFIILGTFAAAAIAAPAQASATCVTGTPASTTSAYQVVDYAAVEAPDTAGSYDIDERFRAGHNVGSVMVSPHSEYGRPAGKPNTPIIPSFHFLIFLLSISLFLLLSPLGLREVCRRSGN